jgi:uncharacterized repeat protein (TIGR01451 family)
LTVVAVGQAADGETSTNGVTVTYTPDAEFSGSDNFTYTISDGELTDTALVSVEVWALADLAVSKSYARSSYQITYTLVASNLGPDDADGATLQDDVATHISNVTWTCAASGGAACASSGSGNTTSESLTSFPMGGVVTFTVVGDIDTLGDEGNSVTIVTPDKVTDPNESNNTVTVGILYKMVCPLIFKEYSAQSHFIRLGR